MARFFSGTALFIFWVMLSGKFGGQYILLGLLSCALVVWLSVRMQLGGQESAAVPRIWPMIKYSGWLVREMITGAVKVARIVLDPELPIKPVLFLAPAGQKTDAGRFIFANSITLTPGTISMAILDGGEQILVHALHEDLSWGEGSCEMDARITALGV
ncbi:MAG: Na+/H+ antiporter subunit E [Alphaproteobacteria bacterium]